MDDEVSSVVLETSTRNIRAGIAGDDAPKLELLNCVGKPTSKLYPTKNLKDRYIYNEIEEKKNLLSYKYPVENGYIEHWDDLEFLWDHCFKDLKIKPEEHPLLLTESPLNPKKNRENMMVSVFEKFNVPASYVSLSPLLSLYASGRGTGVVIECGHGVTTTLPVYEGYCTSSSIRRTETSGWVVTQLLAKFLGERGYNFTTTQQIETVNQIKEKLSYVAQNFVEELQISQYKEPIKYALPTGDVITIGDEAFRCCEALFEPNRFGIEGPGVQDLVLSTIKKTDLDARRDFYGNIIISGGSTLHRGFAERIRTDIEARVPKAMRVKVVAPPERKYSVWIGGSILASLSTFQQMWISKEEYDESGPHIVHRKCF